MKRYSRSVRKGTTCQYEKIQQVSMKRYNSQFENVEQSV